MLETDTHDLVVWNLKLKCFIQSASGHSHGQDAFHREWVMTVVVTFYLPYKGIGWTNVVNSVNMYYNEYAWEIAYWIYAKVSVSI